MCQSDRDSSELIFLKYGTVTGIVINQKMGGSGGVVEAYILYRNWIYSK